VPESDRGLLPLPAPEEGSDLPDKPILDCVTGVRGVADAGALIDRRQEQFE